jgi:hypothetical protein
MENKMDDFSSDSDARIEFPAQDSEWAALQKRVISILGKPIEDLTFGDRTGLKNVLAQTEMDAIYRYARQKRLEDSANHVLATIAKPKRKTARKDEQGPPSEYQIEELRRSQRTADEREKERRSNRRSLYCGVKDEDESLRNSIKVPAGHHIYDLAVIHVKGKRWIYFTDLVARTKEAAQLEAIHRFDLERPRVRLNGWPTRVCFQSIDRKETNIWWGEDVSWESVFPPTEGPLWDVKLAHPKFGNLGTIRIHADGSTNAVSKARDLFATQMTCSVSEVKGQHRRNAKRSQNRRAK